MKSYTDIEQSKVLANILPLESADMYYFVADSLEKQEINYAIRCGTPIVKTDIPCWSLASLIGVIPKGEYIDFDLSFGGYQGVKYIDEWFCAYEKQSHPFLIEVCHAPTPVDACYEMILKLYELNLL